MYFDLRIFFYVKQKRAHAGLFGIRILWFCHGIMWHLRKFGHKKKNPEGFFFLKIKLICLPS